MQVGFVGLGTMGTPMAVNLLKAGYAVRVWNRSPEPAAALVAQGAAAVAAPNAVAHGTDVLISMLSDDDATRAVIVDAGVLDALKPGAIHVNMATVSVAFARAMHRLHQEHSIAYVAAPVLGRVHVAEAGQLQILAAGDTPALERIQPLFDAMGQKTWRLGAAPEQANVVKLAMNFMLASAVETMGEASALTRGYGIAAADFLEIATSTLFAAPAYQGYGGAIAANRFEPAGFKLALGAKDVRLALEAAEAARVPLPIGSVVRDSLLDAMAHGDAQRDLAALARTSARRAAQE